MATGIEGTVWLCEIQGKAQLATERMAYATDLFEEGWWVVRIKWYLHTQGTSPRVYTLLVNSTRWLAVSAVMRVDKLEFEGGQRRQRSGVCVLSDDTYELLRECV